MLSVGGMLFLVAVLIVDSDKGTRESEDFAEGDKDGVVDLGHWWAVETRHYHCASEDAQ